MLGVSIEYTPLFNCLSTPANNAWAGVKGVSSSNLAPPHSFLERHMALEEKNAELSDTLYKLRQDPVLFVESLLGANPQQWQRDALRAIATSDKIAIRSSHGVGKTAFLSWVILWLLTTHYPVKIPCTANSQNQLEQVLWSEIKKWSKKLPIGFQNELVFGADKIMLKNVPESGCWARTAKKDNPEALQGFHGDNLAFIIEEASGVDDIIFEVAQGALSTHGAKVVMVGNPTSSTGYFADAFGKNAERWTKMTVSCYDSEMVSPEWIEDMKRQYGEESNVFRTRCLGLPPETDDDTIISRHLLESAVARDIEGMEVQPVWGCDVARFGSDRSALAKRKGNVLTEPIKTWRDKDIMETVGIVLTEYEATPYLERPAEILVDSIGLGSGVVDRLIELGLPARGINVAESPSLKQKYMKLRDELWFLAREWLEARDCKIVNDEQLIHELASLRYSITSNGKFKCESKDQMKKRGLKSPDLADAFVLTFGGQGVRASGSIAGYQYRRELEYDNKWIV